MLVHGLDRRNYDDGTRRVFFRRIAGAVRRYESQKRHRQTVIAGDFNADPFESAVAGWDGLHAIGLQAIRGTSGRTVRGGAGRTDFFYNPMWRVYGHAHHLHAGAATHFWTGGGTYELGWHMLDQVVLRPGEASRFPESELRIVTEIGGFSLLDPHGLPDARAASDHLPVLFQWNL